MRSPELRQNAAAYRLSGWTAAMKREAEVNSSIARAGRSHDVTQAARCSGVNHKRHLRRHLMCGESSKKLPPPTKDPSPPQIYINKKWADLMSKVMRTSHFSPFPPPSCPLFVIAASFPQTCSWFSILPVSLWGCTAVVAYPTFPLIFSSSLICSPRLSRTHIKQVNEASRLDLQKCHIVVEAVTKNRVLTRLCKIAHSVCLFPAALPLK